MQPTISRIICYALLKYLLFYIVIMFINENYFLISIFKLKNLADFIYYFFLFSALPILYILLFAAALHFAFRYKTHILILIFILISCLEYVIYTYAASPSDYWNGIYNFIISTIAFYLLFNRYLKIRQV
jgi:hypothetical protein